MATPFPFVAGAVLEAAELNAITELPINDQTASYVLVAGDAGKRVIMNAAGATTITVNNSLFVAGQMVFIANKGAGTCTVTAGAGVTVNVNGSLAVTQYGGGTLLALSASSFVFFPGSVKNTLSVEFLVVGGGGGGGNGAYGSGGGGGGGLRTGSQTIGKGTWNILVGAGGATGRNGTASGFIVSCNGGGTVASQGGSGGGSAFAGSVGAGISGEGNNGGTSTNIDPGPGNPNRTGAGGGGGSGGVGGNGGITTNTTGGVGGTGTANSYTGTAITYSAGGGGGGYDGGGAGTTNVSGNGGSNAAPTGTAGSANRGGGGGGMGYTASGSGGAGGSGRVVIRWLTADAAGLSLSTTGSPTNGTDGSYTWYAWDSTGTLVVA